MGLIKAIACMASNRVIGDSMVDKGLPWSWPEDLVRFRALTQGGILLFGRTTWDLIGRPHFPGREVAIVTSKPGVGVSNPAQACLQFRTPEEAFGWYKPDRRIVWVCGGERLYRSTMQYWDGLELSELGQMASGDAYFPADLPSGLRFYDEFRSLDGRGKYRTYQRRSEL